MINGKRYSDIPGDTRMVMNIDRKDRDGRVWPSGTVYQPISIGYYEQLVTIGGQRVVFPR